MNLGEIDAQQLLEVKCMKVGNGGVLKSLYNVFVALVLPKGTLRRVHICLDRGTIVDLFDREEITSTGREKSCPFCSRFISKFSNFAKTRKVPKTFESVCKTEKLSLF